MSGDPAALMAAVVAPVSIVMFVVLSLIFAAWMIFLHVLPTPPVGRPRLSVVAVLAWCAVAMLGVGLIQLIWAFVIHVGPKHPEVPRLNVAMGAIVAVCWFILPGAAYVLRGEDWKRRAVTLSRVVLPWALTVGAASILAEVLERVLDRMRAAEPIVWRNPKAFALLVAAVLAGALAFHVQRRRRATLGFSTTLLVRKRGFVAWISDLPGVCRVLAIAALVVALARPETYRTVHREEDTVDIMIVFDMSKSMDQTDLPRDRMDAAQRVVRRFLRRSKHDRVGLVVFGQQAMLRCPLSQDTRVVEEIVRDLVIGDVPALGTAIGDGLALALAQLRRSSGTCDPAVVPTTCQDGLTCSADGTCQGKKNKVVILLSDGDSNWVTRFEPDEAALEAQRMGVKVYTILVGREDGWFGGMSVNPATLRSIANLTGGEFFRATDYRTFDRGFQTVRNQLDKIRRKTSERIPDKQLFVPFVIVAALLLALELVLSSTRWRRLP